MTPEIRAFIEGPAKPNRRPDMDEGLRVGSAGVMKMWLEEAQARGQLPMILITADPGNSKVPFAVMPGPGLSQQEIVAVLQGVIRAIRAGRVMNEQPRA